MPASRRSTLSGAPSPELTITRYPFELGRNPYQRLLYRALEERGFALGPDRPFTATALVRGRLTAQVLHFNWRLERLHGSERSRRRVAVARLRLRFAKLLGYRIAWTVHELPSRERPGSRDPVTDTLTRVADVFFCHDPDLADRAAAELRIDRSRIDVIPHGPLDAFCSPARIPRDEVRAQLGVAADATVFLAFGVIREYKQVEFLLAAFARVTSPGVRLVVAGEPDSIEYVTLIRRLAERDPRVILLDRRIPEDEVRDLVEASDAWVCGRRDGWTSGSLLLALNLGLPAVVAACPAYLRAIDGDQSGWAFDPEGGEDALASRLEFVAALSPEDRRAVGARGAASSHELTWDGAAARIASRLRGRGEPVRVALEPDTVDA